MKLHATCLYFGMSTSAAHRGRQGVCFPASRPPPMKGVTNKTALGVSQGDRRAHLVRHGRQAKTYSSADARRAAGQRQLLISRREAHRRLEAGGRRIALEDSVAGAIRQTAIASRSCRHEPVRSSRRATAAGAMLVEIPRTGSGFSAAGVEEPRISRGKFNHLYLRSGFVYGLDEGILTCIDAADRDAPVEGRVATVTASCCWPSGHSRGIVGRGRKLVLFAPTLKNLRSRRASKPSGARRGTIRRSRTQGAGEGTLSRWRALKSERPASLRFRRQIKAGAGGHNIRKSTPKITLAKALPKPSRL